MALLGVTITDSDAAPSAAVPTGTSAVFAAGTTTSGPTDTAVRVTSMADFINHFGARPTTDPSFYDGVEAHFREGGSEVWVAKLGGTTAADFDAALALFRKDYGPGQVALPGQTSADAHTALLAHAEANARHALLDAPDTGVIADLQTASDDAGDANRESGSMYAPFMRIPGVTPGTTRKIAPSMVVAALMAQADTTGNPNVAPAGRDWPLTYVLSFEREFSDADRLALLDGDEDGPGNVNTFRTLYGVRCLYGYRTLASQDDAPTYWQVNRARTKMAVKARLNAVGEHFMFRELDGRGVTLGAFSGALAASLQELYDVGALFGTTASEAFGVNVGPSVNTPTTMANGELHAVVSIRVSPHAEGVIEELVTVPISQAL
jgi:hypothetical protein